MGRRCSSATAALLWEPALAPAMALKAQPPPQPQQSWHLRPLPLLPQAAARSGGGPVVERSRSKRGQPRLLRRRLGRQRARQRRSRQRLEAAKLRGA